VCSSGTYVRTLAADLGAALGGGAHLRRLRRLAVGSYGVEESVRLDALEAALEPAQMVLGPLEALRGMARLTVTGEMAGAVAHGQVMPLGALRERGGAGPGPWAVLSAEGMLLAVYEVHGPQGAKPAVVLSRCR
jgi:tRNA pseudouridine55 synthase